MTAAGPDAVGTTAAIPAPAPAGPAGRSDSDASPDFSPWSRSASRPGVRSARSGPKSVAGTTVEARDVARDARGAHAAGGRLGATRRAALSGRQRASSRLPDAPRRAEGARIRATRCSAFLLCRPESAAQTMTMVRKPGKSSIVGRAMFGGRRHSQSAGRDDYHFSWNESCVIINHETVLFLTDTLAREGFSRWITNLT